MRFSVYLSDGQYVSPPWRDYSDPYAVAWVIVGLYFVSVLLSAWCCIGRRRLIAGPTYWRFGLFWLLMCLGLGVLGLNKQLDLHVRAIDLSRPILDERGWYATRDDWLPYVVISIAVMSLVLLAAAVLVMRGLWSRVWVAVLGAGVLCFFVFERGYSVWVKKLPLEQEVWLGMQINHLIEMVGIALIIGGAGLNLLRPENHGPTPQS